MQAASCIGRGARGQDCDCQERRRLKLHLWTAHLLTSIPSLPPRAPAHRAPVAHVPPAAVAPSLRCAGAPVVSFAPNPCPRSWRRLCACGRCRHARKLRPGVQSPGPSHCRIPRRRRQDCSERLCSSLEAACCRLPASTRSPRCGLRRFRRHRELLLPSHNLTPWSRLSEPNSACLPPWLVSRLFALSERADTINTQRASRPPTTRQPC